MGSDLYNVRVEKQTKTTVRLRVEAIHPDAPTLSNARSFALMLLRDGAKTRDALAKEVTATALLDPSWQAQHASSFVKKVTAAKGVVEITATAPEWIAHAKPGATWKSRAFPIDVTRAAVPGKTPRDDDAFLRVPAAVLRIPDLPAPKIRFAEMPIYDGAAYRAIDAQQKAAITPELLKKREGRAVAMKSPYGNVTGALVKYGTQYLVFSMTPAGATWTPVDGATSLALVELNPKGRRGTPLTRANMPKL
ncbi:MAG TPA: hypothetical protein VGM90_20805 [Kofleriaceae bacterium]|jgi:hypothetical protein